MAGRPLRKIPCGARRKYDGQPCQAKALPSGRCKLHGGMSTGQKTLDGKIKAYRNLKPFKNKSDEDIRSIIEGKYSNETDGGNTFNQDL